ncbi:ribosome silencing factor [Bifidobacterium sp.]|uniref:ribosome silencing factor n=1 Tax=Bifidobacterium sp. TaxID=41200 RepID=UPI0025C28DA3|nr:ribosome silencing factor [Bifidobacterium sp.]MCI1635637.1 ribosome silencing factor [Bifidobacterium sp.]
MPAVQDSIECARIAALAADKVKAEDIVAFDVTEPLAITDIFLLATGNNERQVLAIAEEIEKELSIQRKRETRTREGLEDAQWVLLDYGDFVIHVMHKDAREYYSLERLWSDCPKIDLQLPEHDESTDHNGDADGVTVATAEADNAAAVPAAQE